MIDAICLLLNRAPFDYLRAASIRWFSSRHHDAPISTTDENMIAAPPSLEAKKTARKFGYAVTGILLAVLLGPLIVIGLYTILTSIMSL